MAADRVIKKESRVLENIDAGPFPGPLIEICFKGKHYDYCGNELIEYVRSTVQQLRPAGVLLNLSEFKYSFGNDIGALLFPLVDRPFCIVASGGTASALKSLFGLILNFPEIEEAKFYDIATDGLEYLRKILKGIDR